MSRKNSAMKGCFAILFALLALLSITAINNLYIGSCPENEIANVLSRFYSSFRADSLFDAVVFIAFTAFFLWAFKKEWKFSISAAIISGILSFLLVLCTFYKNFNSTEYMYCDKYQMAVTCLEIIGFAVLIYFVLRTIEQWYVCEEKREEEKKASKAFLIISAIIIFISWMVWIILAYPGGTNPDAVVQLKNFYNDTERTAWQPPFSTLIMGGLFNLGRSIKDADFGFFLYETFQALAGAVVFSYSLWSAVKNGIKAKHAFIGTAFFAFLPMWGAYAQWFEKDFLYTVSVVLFLTLAVNVFLKRECTIKDLISLIIAGIVMSLLRGNGIFAIIPTLVALAFYMQGKSKRRLLISVGAILLCFELTTRVLYPCIGIGKTSISETIGFMFQATARYVTEYPDEVTDYEKEVLSANFQSYDNLFNYNPRISDPVKIYYNHSDFKAYLDVWFKMFAKHPMTYVESVLNGSYGYLAPVSQDIGPWIVLEGYDFYLENLGVKVNDSSNSNLILVWLLNINKDMPLLRYLVTPGLYSWISIILAWIVIKNKIKGGWVLLLPNFINILVCIASPLADAMRYALPTVACAPLLIFAVAFLLKKGKSERYE